MRQMRHILEHAIEVRHEDELLWDMDMELFEETPYHVNLKDVEENRFDTFDEAEEFFENFYGFSFSEFQELREDFESDEECLSYLRDKHYDDDDYHYDHYHDDDNDDDSYHDDWDDEEF